MEVKKINYYYTIDINENNYVEIKNSIHKGNINSLKKMKTSYEQKLKFHPFKKSPGKDEVNKIKLEFKKNFKKTLTANSNKKNFYNENDQIQQKLLETIFQQDNEDKYQNSISLEKNQNKINHKTINSSINNRTTCVNSRVNTRHPSNKGNENYKNPNVVKEFSSENQEKIIEIFRKLFVFDVFPDDILENILSSLVLLSVTKGDFLYKKGSLNNFFYIVVKGEFEKIFDKPEENKITIYKEWSYFGIDTLMNKNKITLMDHSLLSKQDSEVLILDGDRFLQIKQGLISIILNERYEFINNILFFKNLDAVLKYNLAEKIELINFMKDEIIIRKGDKENKSIYFIKRGSVRCCLNGDDVKILGENKYFGIIALILHTERTLDVIAGDNCQCFELTENDLIDCIGENYTEIILFSIFRNVVTNNHCLYDFINDDNLQELFHKFKLNQYKKNEKIHENITKNNLSKKRIIITLAGNFVEEKTMQIIYSSGCLIGETTLNNQSEIRNDLIAFPDLISLEANLNEIEEILGDEYKEKAMNVKSLIKKLEKISIFKFLDENSLKSILNGLTKERYTKGKIIINENTPPDNFYIILKGTAIVTKKGKLIRHIDKGASFGEISILNNKNRTTTVTAYTNCSCLIIDKEHFLFLYENEKVKQFIFKKISLQNDEIEYDDLYFMKHLGQGQFGSVSLVHNNSFIYGIKAILKHDANLKRRLADYIIAERNIMLTLDHPFVVKLIRTFKNKIYVFLLLEYVNGISLHTLLKSGVKNFNMTETRFYIASLLLVIDYIHKKKIVHRDIKPHNIMLNSKGYIKLIDFGTSKIMNDYTSTVIGTPHYMAPEILNGRGYSFSCDYWSIGIVTYEIFYKCFPFGEHARDVMEIYHDIMYSPNFKYPYQNSTYNCLNELIDSLLNKKIEKRICSLNNIKKLDLFYNFNWNDLLNCNLKTPFIPDVPNLSKINLSLFNMKYDEYIGGDTSEYIKENPMEDSSWDEDF